ncbi:unnamed protein product [Closterium sp. NIES-54]
MSAAVCLPVATDSQLYRRRKRVHSLSVDLSRVPGLAHRPSPSSSHLLLTKRATILETLASSFPREHEQRNSRRIPPSGSSASNPRVVDGECISPLSTSPSSWRPRSPTVVRSPHAEIIRQKAESAQAREAEMDRAWESAERAWESTAAAENPATSSTEKEGDSQPNVSRCCGGDSYCDDEDSLSTSPLKRLNGSKFAAWRSLLSHAASRLLTQPLNLSRTNQGAGSARERCDSGIKDSSRRFHAMLVDLQRGIESGAREGASSPSTIAAHSPSATDAPHDAHSRGLHRRAWSLTSITTTQEFSLVEDSAAGVLSKAYDLHNCSSNGEDAARRAGHDTENAAAGAGSRAPEEVDIRRDDGALASRQPAGVLSPNASNKFVNPRGRRLVKQWGSAGSIPRSSATQVAGHSNTCSSPTSLILPNPSPTNLSGGGCTSPPSPVPCLVRRHTSASPFHGRGASAHLTAPSHGRKVSFNSVVQVRVYMCAET